MKKFLTLLSIVLLVTGLCACGQKEEVKPEEETVEPELVKVPEDLQGLYYDEIAGRASMDIGADEVSVHWGSSAFEAYDYHYTAAYDSENGRIILTDGVLIDTVFESDEKSTATEIYNDGTGYLEPSDGKLIWHDDKAEEGSEDVVLIKNGEINDMINPWKYTDDLDEAIAGAGIDFSPATCDGFELVRYGYNINGVIEAVYEDETRQMIVRKSVNYEGQELSGNFNEYSTNWEHTFKGVTADLYGDGDTVNQAYFGMENHFSVSVMDKNYQVTEGNGITLDNLNSIINGMQ